MKRFFAILLILLMSVTLIVGCTEDNTDDTGTDTSTDTENLSFSKYEYDMSQYVTLAGYQNHFIDVELDAIQATIDDYIMNYATEYVVKNGDDVYVDVKAYEVLYTALENGTLIDRRGDEIAELTENALLIENIGSGSYAQVAEAAVVDKNIGFKTSLKIRLPQSFYKQEWANKEVFIDITLASKECKRGDVVTVSYTGYHLDEDGNRGKSFDSSSATKFFLGAHLAIDDFETNIAGMKVGETKSFMATFPSDYASEEFRNETVEFEVTLKTIYVAPTYNDEFVSTYFDVETTEKFEQSLKENIILNEALEYIVDNTEIIGYPSAEYLKELASLEDIRESFESAYGTTLEEYLRSVYGTTVDEYIKSNMKSEMIYYTIAKAQGIEPSEDELNAEEESLILYYTEYYKSSEGLDQNAASKKAAELVSELGEEYVYENVLYALVDRHLIDDARVTYIEKTYTSVTENQ